MPSYMKSRGNRYNMSNKGAGQYGGVKKQHRGKKGCDYGMTGARSQAPGSGAAHNTSARSTTGGHGTLKMGLAKSKSGSGTYRHPYGNAKPKVY